MMNPLTLLALLNPLTWQQIDITQELVLNETISLSASVTLLKNSHLLVNDLIPLDEIRVLSYQMSVSPCPNALKDQTAEMTIVQEKYGFQLEKNCRVDVFVENDDLSLPSLFAESKN